MGVILQCKLVMQYKQVSKLPYVSLFQIVSAKFPPNIIQIGFSVGKK